MNRGDGRTGEEPVGAGRWKRGAPFGTAGRAEADPVKREARDGNRETARGSAAPAESGLIMLPLADSRVAVAVGSPRGMTRVVVPVKERLVPRGHVLPVTIGWFTTTTLRSQGKMANACETCTNPKEKKKPPKNGKNGS